jgi:dTDP-4-amino-4,6-dideoxygalactose transaminase
MITTADEAIAERARTLRFHGSREKLTHQQVGYNSRLDELQAAILRVQLPHLDRWAQGRLRAGELYEREGLGKFARLPRTGRDVSPAWHLYVVAHPEPERLEAALRRDSIGHRAYYRTPIHRQPAMREWARDVELPATEEAARTHVAIPMSPLLSEQQAREVVAAVASA